MERRGCSSLLEFALCAKAKQPSSSAGSGRVCFGGTFHAPVTDLSEQN